MMLKKILLLFLIFLKSICFAQKVDTAEFKNRLILTSEQHKAWFDQFKSLDKRQQILFLQERINLDTNVVLPVSFPDAHLLKKGDSYHQKIQDGKFLGCCKPLILINGYYFSEAAYELRLVKKLDLVKNLLGNIVIDSVLIFEDVQAAALYGKIGSGGTIIFKVSERKSLLLVDKVAREIKKYREASKK